MAAAAHHAGVTAPTKAAALPPALDDIALRQAGVVSRTQLRAAGVDRWHVRNQIQARRWHLIGRRVVVLHRGELSARQRQWVAVLNAGPRAALAQRTALAAGGLAGWQSDAVHVVVPKGTRVPPLPGVAVHQVRELVDIDWRKSPPRVRLERAAMDTASAACEPRIGCALLAAVVQQRLTTAARLRKALIAAPRVRHRRLMLAVLDDIEGGAHALSEIDFIALCRRAGLSAPTQQAVRTDRYGKRRYLDATWELPDGRTVSVEIDGALHLLAATYWDDMDRQNELVLSGETVLRYPSVVLRTSERRVVEQLRRALSPDRLSKRAL